MFSAGEYVVYGSKGVCIIDKIGPVDMPGVDRDQMYYIMHQVTEKGSTVYLPVDNNKAVIRKIMTAQEAKALLNDIPSISELSVASEKLREASYKEALRTCDCRAWVSMIKTLYTRKCSRIAAGKKTTSLDDRYFRTTENALYGELSVVLGIPIDEVSHYITDHIER